FSYGVIEHFDRPEEIIRIFSSFLNPGGMIITLVPNLNGLIGSVCKHFVPDIYRMHKVITREQLRQFHESNSLDNLKTGYAGTFVLGVVPLVRSNHWLLREGTWRRRLVMPLFGLIDKVLSRFFIWFRIDIPSKRFSPYIISIAGKKTGT
ncbi:MAG TPA: hypothetical protein VNW04_09280, partial [Puia sp.]|nr:hypothetical protein [Puia sp.]